MMLSSTCLKEKLVVYIKDMNIYCQVCDCNIKKRNWGKHLKTTKHGIACGDIVVEEVEKKQCCKCGGHKVLDMFSGENATCNVCLAHTKKWADKNPEKVRELSRKYGEEHKEEKKVYNQEYNQREVECEVCRCKVRKCNWLRHLETRKHRDGVGNGGGGGDMDVDAEGAGRRSWTVP